MRVAHYLIRGQTGLFYFRLRVPAELRQLLGVRLIKRALATRCPRTAQALAIVYAARYAHAFAMVRKGEPMPNTPTPADIKRNLRDAGGNPAEYVVKSGPGGFEIQAEGAEEHARAMEAVAQIGKIAPGAFLPVSATAPSAPIKRITLKDAKAKWEGAIKNTDPKTIGAKKRALKDLLEWKQKELNKEAQLIGGPGAVASPVFVDEIDEQTGGDWFIYLNSQTKFSKKKNMIVPGYSPGTMENKFIYAAGFFDWAMTNGHYSKAAVNPMRDHANVPKKVKKARAKSHGAQAFEPAQIAVMFQSENFKRMRRLVARWMPVLLLYTGARSNEIGRLELADIYEFPKGCKAGEGTKVLDFSRVGNDKSLKNENSERITPIHPDLVALGFWQQVEQRRVEWQAQEARLLAAWKAKAPSEEIQAIQRAVLDAQKLFPGLTFGAQNGPANAPQTAFRRMLKEAGIQARGDGKFGHHSFRDTVKDKMKHARVPLEVRDEYVGHGKRDDENAAAYEQNFSPSALAKLCHPALDWGLPLEALKPLLSAGLVDGDEELAEEHE